MCILCKSLSISGIRYLNLDVKVTIIKVSKNNPNDTRARQKT